MSTRGGPPNAALLAAAGAGGPYLGQNRSTADYNQMDTAVGLVKQQQREVSAECTRLTRRLNVCITGTLSNFFAEGHGAATWKPLDGRTIKIFGHGAEVTDLASSTNALRNAYIVGCKLLEHRSTFPVPLGVSMSCIPNNELTETGDRYAFTVLPMSTNSHPYILFEADASQTEGFEWRTTFPEYTDGNLETHNILEVQGCPYVFVHEKHPVIHLLRANHEILGSKIDEHSKIDGEWFKVSKQVLGTCCQTIRTKILSRISFNDLNLFQVQLKRIDAKDWTDIGEVLQEHILDRELQFGARAGPAASSSAQPMSSWDGGSNAVGGGGVEELMSILDKPCSFMARIELTYEIPH
jgi:hypothetical protein